MDDRELVRRLEEPRAKALAGDLDGAEADLISLLTAVRGQPTLELEVISKLTAVYGLSGRGLESLSLANRELELARSIGNRRAEAKALGSVCIGRYSLYVGAEISEEIQRARALLADVTADSTTAGLLMQHAYVDFAHAIDHDDTERARSRRGETRAITNRATRRREIGVGVVPTTAHHRRPVVVVVWGRKCGN